MKKQELIHLHGLLSEVRDRHENRIDATLDLSLYESLDTHPTSIHHSKTDHKEAVIALANGLASEMDDEEPTAVPASAD
ncbi:metal-binding protein [halophilic archaeon]|nr:metal-binding protein [halophilic archaeon]